MAWLRIDDDFARHPKLLELTHRERWGWMSILCYCARYRTNGNLPRNLLEALPEITPKLVQKALRIGLLESNGTGLQVHDWNDYNPKDPSGALRAKRYRDRDANRDANRDAPRDAPRDDTVTPTVTNPVTTSRPVPVTGLTEEKNSYGLPQDAPAATTCPDCGTEFLDPSELEQHVHDDHHVPA